MEWELFLLSVLLWPMYLTLLGWMNLIDYIFNYIVMDFSWNGLKMDFKKGEKLEFQDKRLCHCWNDHATMEIMYGRGTVFGTISMNNNVLDVCNSLGKPSWCHCSWTLLNSKRNWGKIGVGQNGSHEGFSQGITHICCAYKIHNKFNVSLMHHWLQCNLHSIKRNFSSSTNHADS